MIIHLNGMPGVGKMTVAKILARRINARLIDNHLLIDLVTTVCERQSPDYPVMIKKIMEIVLEQVAETPNEVFIFTNALATESRNDRERFEQIRRAAEKRKTPFVQIWLTCDLEENKRRIVSENRRLKGKLIDPHELEKLDRKYKIYHPPAEFSLSIDTTNLTADEIADRISNHLENLTIV
jgi:shikimate kinase